MTSKDKELKMNNKIRSYVLHRTYILHYTYITVTVTVMLHATS